MKTFFDGVFIEREELEKAGVKYPIKLEYFKTYGEENVNLKFGIEIVKTEYLDTKVNVETKSIKNIIETEERANEILKVLKRNEVTPIALEDVLEEIL